MAQVGYTPDIARLYVLTHPVRIKIGKILIDSRGLFIYEVEERIKKFGIDLEKKIVSYHLMRLEHFGLVKTYLKETERKDMPAARFIEPTEEMYKTFAVIERE